MILSVLVLRSESKLSGQNNWVSNRRVINQQGALVVNSSVHYLHFFLYKNQPYKNKEAQNDPKFKNKLRTTRGSNSAKTKKLI